MTKRATVLVVLSMLVSMAGTGDTETTAGYASNGAAAAPVLAVSTAGDDRACLRGNLARPCLTFARAYQLARCGDTIQIAAGTYPSQVVVENPALNTCTSPVSFSGSRGVLVDSQVRLGSCQGCFSTDAPSNVVFSAIAYTDSFIIWGDSRNLTLDGLDGGGLHVEGATNVSVRNSDFGPCNSSPPGACYRVFILDYAGNPTKTTNVLFERNVVHDFMLTQAGDHWECIFVTGGANVTIKDNRIYNCDTYGMRLDGALTNWIIENNSFGDTCCYGGLRGMGGTSRSSAILVSGAMQVLVRFNSFIAGQGVVNEGGPAVPNVRVFHNILQYTGCLDGARYSGNLVTGGRCSPDDLSSVYGYQFDGIRLWVDKPRAKAVQTSFRLVVEGMTVRQTARSLSRAKFPPPPGGWTGIAVIKLVKDDIYLGKRLGRQSQHAPLVSIAQWKRAQAALRAKGR